MVEKYNNNQHCGVMLNANKVKKVAVNIAPSFIPASNIVLTQENEGYWEIESHSSYSHSHKACVPPERINKLTKLLNLILPETQQTRMGLDGTTCSIKFTVNKEIIAYEWWSDAPEGYMSLWVLMKFIVKLAEA